jgi:hypothetical protein
VIFWNPSGRAVFTGLRHLLVLSAWKVQLNNREDDRWLTYTMSFDMVLEYVQKGSR